MFQHAVLRAPARRRPFAVAVFAAFVFFGQTFFSAQAQSPAPLLNPNLQFLSAGGIPQSSGMVLQRDGKLVIASGASTFERIGGVVGQRRLARLNADGSLDSAFTLDTNGSTFVDPGGDFVYVSGSFTTIGGIARSGFARFSALTGQVDSTWNPPTSIPTTSFSSPYFGVVADSSNATYVIASQSNTISKLDPVTGAPVQNWVAGIPAGLSPAYLAINQSSLYVVCTFGAGAGGVRANRIFKLSTLTGAADPSFSPDLDAIDFNIFEAKVGVNGDLYLASPVPPAFTSGGPAFPAPRKFLRLLATTGAIAPEWQAPATPGILHMEVTPQGIFAIRGISQGDSFSRWGVMRYDLTTGRQDPNWTTQLLEQTQNQISGGIASNGTDLYYGGVFTHYGTTRRSGLAKLSTVDGSVLPSFVPDLRSSRPNFAPIAHILPDGGAVVGGDFVEVNGIPTDGLIRVRPDGTFDPAWRPSTIKGVVTSLRTMGNFIYAAGNFSEVGSSPRPGFARFNAADGSLDISFQPPAVDGPLSYFATDGNDVFISGSFRNVGGSPRVCAAKLNGVTGALVPQWAPPINLPATVGSSQCSGFQRIDAAGQFVYLITNNNFIVVGSALRRHVRVSTTTGAVDAAWDPRPNNESPANAVNRMLVYNGNLYVFGNFNNIKGQNTRSVARFATDASGALDPGFTNTTDIGVFGQGNLAVGPDGVFVSYSQATGTGASTTYQQRVSKFSLSNGALDTAWTPFQGSPSNTVSNTPFVHLLSPSTLLVYGNIPNVGSTPRQGVAFVPTGSSSLLALPRPDIKVLRNASLSGVATQPDGKLIVGGDFTTVDGLPRTNLVRLNANGSLDTSFNVSVDGQVFVTRVAGNFAYIGGDFTKVGGVPRSGLARINLTTGALDGGWDPNLQPRDILSDFAADASGNLYVYGGIMSVGGISGVQVAKILPTGQADPLFRGFPNIFSREIKVSANGAIYVTGTVAPAQPTQNYRIFKLNPVNGAIDTSWNPSLQAIDMQVYALDVSATGDVYIGGQTSGNAVVGQTFTAPRNFVKLNAADGAVASAWSPPPASSISAISVDSSGAVYAVRAVFFSNESAFVINKYDGNTGAIDPNFNAPNAGGGNTDFGLLAVPDGLLIGGGINTVGTTRTGTIAKINLASGALLTNFATNLRTPGFLSAVRQMSNGKIMVGGYFSKIDDVEVNNLARLNADGTVDATWTLGWPNFVSSIRERGNSLYVSSFPPAPTGYVFSPGPNFVTPQAEFVSKLDINTGAREPGWGLKTDGRVRAEDYDPATNSLYIMGTFTNVNGSYKPCVAKVDATTGILDPSWAPAIRNNANNQNLGFGLNCGRSLRVSGNNVYMGLFSTVTSGGSARFVVNGQNRFLARANLTSGAIDPTWDPAPNGQVTAMTLNGNDLYFTGGFNSISGVSTRVAKFSAANGAIDSSFANILSGVPSSPQAIRTQSGSVFVAGAGAGSTNDFSKPFVWRLTGSGALDTAWNPDFDETRTEATFGVSIDVFGSDGLLVAGGFQRVGTQARSALAGFSAKPQVGLTLNVRGRGTVVLQGTGSAANGSCADCSSGTYAYAFDTGSTVTLTAISTPSSVFTGWSGGTGSATCGGTGPCVIPLSAVSSVTASFRRPSGFSEQ